jgi:hypothetical protein
LSAVDNELPKGRVDWLEDREEALYLVRRLQALHLPFLTRVVDVSSQPDYSDSGSADVLRRARSSSSRVLIKEAPIFNPVCASFVP